MEFVSAIISPIVESLIVPVKKQLGYLFYSTKHVRNMNAKMKLLDGTSTDVKKQMDANNIRNLEIPARVSGWLEDVEKIKEDAESISSTGNGCFNMKMRYRAGRNAYKITEEMGSLIDENSKIIWMNAQKPLGKVNSKIASTSAPSHSDAQNHFKSREKGFKDALEFLQQDHNSQVIALCGMGGVGKTTMMEQLKNTAEDKKMFDWILKVVIGQKIDMDSIQQALAVYLGQPLPEKPLTARADLLSKRFGKMSEEKKKVLVILDDVWEAIELKEIGLSPLPNGFKLLLTSRYGSTCSQIAGEANLAFNVVRVDVMEEFEAQNFFFHQTGVAKQYDHELNHIGSEIVRRCGFLPLAIKLIATTLKSREAYLWRDALKRLKKNDLDKNVQKIIEMSYTYITEEEEKTTFLLCGLFPDDFDIPVEELTRYAWGLQLFREVSTLGEARDRTKTCVHSLKNANLLIDSDYIGCVKMHDLVRAYVLGVVSKGDHAWMVNHGDISKGSRAGMRDSCKRVSITCKGISEFPTHFGNSNVSLLRLMDGDESLRFPADFYGRMENLEVIAYEKMQHPLLPRSLPKLRTLILHQCLLMFDCSAIGELLHLEVLSFAHCGIRKLPAEIGKLKELKLLDLTGCVYLCIDDGVLKKLYKLEELYMRAVKGKTIKFTDGNRAELAELTEHLSAVEVEFFGNNHIPENMLFTKLERFRISMGRSLEDNKGKNMHSFENTLMLVTNQAELLDSGLNELFQKTEVLYLEVDGMNDLEAVQFPQHSFNKLRVLDVFKCANLKNLFTVPMANGLMKLERLTVSQCPDLEVLVYGEKSGDGVIKFQGLKFLSLDNLPELIGFSNIVNVIELPELVELRLDGLPNFTSIYPEKTSATSSMSSNISAIQPFFNKEVSIPKLKILKIFRMNKLKNIWPHQVSSSDEVNACMLREIEVKGCDDIVNLFPINPMWLLRHLEELRVDECGSIEVLFDIDMSCVGEIEEYSSNLRHINVSKLGTLRELWRVKGVSSSGILMRSFRAVERIEINKCECFVNVFTPSVTKSDVRTLMNVSIDGKRLWGESGINIQLVQKSQEIDVISKGEISEDEGFISAIPMTLNHLYINICKDVEVVFEMESSSSSSSSTDLTTTRHNHHQPLLLLPYLKNLDLAYMERMSHVWKCNWNKLVIPQNQSQSSFHNLTTIHMRFCKSIKYLFSPLMGKLLPNLKEVDIWNCDGMEEVVSDRDIDDNDEMVTSVSTTLTNTISFPLLEMLRLWDLPNLKSIDGGNARGRSSAITTTSIHDHFKVGVASWFLCQHSKKIHIWNCHALSRVFPSDVAGQPNKLEELRILDCKSMVEVFEREEGNSDGVQSSNKVGDGSDDTCTTMTIPRSANMTLLQLPNLTILQIERCERLEYIFTSSTLESLKHLKELTVEKCEGMQVIVKEEIIGMEEVVSDRDIVENDEMDTSISTTHTNTIYFPLLEKLELWGLRSLKSIDGGNARGRSSAITTTSIHDHFKVGVASWFLCQHSKKIDIYKCHALSRVFPSDVAGQPNKLEELRISNCESMVEIFEREEGNCDGVQSSNKVGDGSDDTCTTMTIPRSANMTLLQLPNLTILYIKNCERLEYIFTSSTLGSLRQLKELTVEGCKAMQVIVKEDGEHTAEASKTIVFPRLLSLTLVDLPDLKGFFLGMNELEWKVLEKVKMYGCPQMMSLTSGRSVAPKLKYIHTGFSKHSLEECGLNFHLTNETQETQLPMSSTPDMTKLLQLPCSFSNLVEVDAKGGYFGNVDKLLKSRIIFPCNELLKLENLEKLCITDKYGESEIEEVFEVEEGTNDDVNIQTQSVVVFQKLKEVTLDGLNKLSHIWKNNPRIVLNFPNLTKVSISRCGLLGHVFTSCMVSSLLQLQELQISDCRKMDVIVKQVEDSEARPTEVEFPCLKSVTLKKLRKLKGFYLGKEAFVWQSLDTLEIKECPQIEVFTNGQSTTPELKLIDTTFGLCHATEDPNSFIKTKQQEGWEF